MLETLGNVLLKIGTSVTASFVSRFLRRASITLPATISSHLKRLEHNVRAMPFIYKDLDGDVINDFVDVEMESVDLATLKIVPIRKVFNIANDQKLRDARKLIFLGNAGVGKTGNRFHPSVEGRPQQTR